MGCVSLFSVKIMMKHHYRTTASFQQLEICFDFFPNSLWLRKVNRSPMNSLNNYTVIFYMAASVLNKRTEHSRTRFSFTCVWEWCGALLSIYITLNILNCRRDWVKDRSHASVAVTAADQLWADGCWDSLERIHIHTNWVPLIYQPLWC